MDSSNILKISCSFDQKYINLIGKINGQQFNIKKSFNFNKNNNIENTKRLYSIFYEEWFSLYHIEIVKISILCFKVP